MSATLRLVLAGLLLGGIVAVAWPAQRGGFVTLAIVNGHSMEPEYHTGDLLLAFKRPGGYGVGDVIVYDVSDGDLRGRVVHRVVRQLPSGNLVTQGDNKSIPDPWEVRPDWILGEVGYLLPQAGTLVRVVRTPVFIGTVAGLLAVLLLWPREVRRGG